MPTHQAAYFLISGSEWERRARRGVQRERLERLFALSRDSMSCSKLSKAMSLFSRVVVGSWRTSIAAFIRSASEGPPMRAERISGLRSLRGAGWERGGEGAEGSAEGLETVECSIPHLRRLVRFLSILFEGVVVMMVVVEGFEMFDGGVVCDRRLWRGDRVQM